MLHSTQFKKVFPDVSAETSTEEAGTPGYAAPPSPPAANLPGGGRLFTKKELADHLNVSVRTIDYEIEDGRLTPVRIRSAVRFSPEMVNRYLQMASRGLASRPHEDHHDDASR